MKHVFQTLIVMAVIVCGTLFCRTVNAQPILGAIVTADLPRYQKAHQAMVKVLQAQDEAGWLRVTSPARSNVPGARGRSGAARSSTPRAGFS